MTQKRQRLLYSLYIIITVAFFLYVLFPSDTVKKYIIYKVNQINPDVGITIGSIKPVFPSGLRFNMVKISHENSPLVDAKQIRITPSYLSLFILKPAFAIKVKAYDGVLKGKVGVSGLTSERKILVDANMAGLKLKDIPIKENRVSGTIDGKVTYKSGQENPEAASVDLLISDCKVVLSTPPMNMDILKNLSFKTVMIKAEADMKRVKIEQCDIKGDQADGSISGVIKIRKPMDRSSLKLDGTIKPQPVFLSALSESIPAVSLLLGGRSSEKGLPFKITGTIGNPGYALK